MGQRAKRAMRGGVAVAAHNGQPRQGEALLRPSHMNNALANVIHRQIFDAKLGAIGFQRFDLQFAFRVFNRRETARSIRCRNIVVGHSKRFMRRAWTTPGHTQAFKSLWAGNFVYQMAVNI